VFSVIGTIRYVWGAVTLSNYSSYK